jgi:anti-sigma-K factor RskA
VSCERRNDAACYAVGALDAREARVFRQHLSHCEECQAEIASLQAVVDTLPMAAPQIDPPRALKSRIMRVVDAEAELFAAATVTPPKVRRRRLPSLTPALAAAMACVLLALGVVTGTAINGPDGPPPVRTVAAADEPAGSRVRVEVAADGHTDLVLDRMPAPPEGKVWQVWRLDRAGQVVPTRTLFTTPADGRARVQVDGGVTGAKALLVSAEPAGGSRAPTSAPVIQASV